METNILGLLATILYITLGSFFLIALYVKTNLKHFSFRGTLLLIRKSFFFFLSTKFFHTLLNFNRRNLYFILIIKNKSSLENFNETLKFFSLVKKLNCLQVSVIRFDYIVILIRVFLVIVLKAQTTIM